MMNFISTGLVKTFSFSLLLFAAMACGGSENSGARQDFAGTPCKIERFDSLVYGFSSMDSLGVDSLIEQYKPAMSLMERIFAANDATQLMNKLAQSEFFNVFFPDVANRLGSLADTELELGLLCERLPQAVDSLRFPSRVFGIVTPYGQSIVLSDSVMLIGLNHYLGADYAGYEGFEDYRRRLKTPSRIPIDVAEALVYSSYPFEQSASTTAVQRMVYEGAVVAAVAEALPQRELSDILGYAPEQYAWLAANEGQIWKKLVADGLLYSHDRGMQERLVMPAPFTSVISPEAPGRAGRYIGYRIVDSYLRNNPDVSLADILQGKISLDDEFLMKSGYRGK